MRSEARKQAGETLLDHMQALGDIETEMADLITPGGVLWRSDAVIPAASAPGEELSNLTHHRVFACLSGDCGLQEVTPERVSAPNKTHPSSGRLVLIFPMLYFRNLLISAERSKAVNNGLHGEDVII